MILFVDDEPVFTSSYRDELELENYNVVLKRKLDEAWAVLDEEGPSVQLLILDVMMPSSDLIGMPDEGGMRTGLLFFEKVRQRFPDLPVVVFTNISDKNVKEFFEKQSRCWVMNKFDYLPYQLADKIKTILDPSAQ
ncbi:MAG TPA: response regulator [Pyrinomonadaceae bacterium]|jgi:CheY-like chemotaxis protein